MRIHLIAIGGKVMHNLALELQERGHVVSGSDDEIYEPSKSRLQNTGLLPLRMGWDENRITPDIDLVILGMHAHADNPELQKAQELEIPVQSFPEYAGHAFANKTRIVVSGSHGKSTITAMIMHVLQKNEVKADYLLGGMLDGFDRMVSFTDAPIAVIEGDEYLSSRIDPSPKMMHYHANILILTGIEWDHKNVFPTWENYVVQFENVIKQAKDNGAHVIWYEPDETLRSLMETYPLSHSRPYDKLASNSNGDLVTDYGDFPIKVFGDHNLSNLNAALLACQKVGVGKEGFYKSISSFRGVGKRLQKIADKPIVYLDYAHAPSKVKATVRAVRSRHKLERVLAVYELHTYSSLSKDFLPQYAGAMDGLEKAIVYFDHHALEMKRLPELEKKDVEEGFKTGGLLVTNEKEELVDLLKEDKENYDVFLFMSSGTFSGIDIKKAIISD